jgi:hypothetical protein
MTNRHTDQQIDLALAYSERFITLFAGALFLVLRSPLRCGARVSQTPVR